MTAAKPLVLFPVGTPIRTRDGVTGTVVEVLTTARLWVECDPDEPGVLSLPGFDGIFPRPLKLVEVAEVPVGLGKQPVEPRYRVRYDAPGPDGGTVEGWRSAWMLTRLDGRAGGGTA